VRKLHLSEEGKSDGECYDTKHTKRSSCGIFEKKFQQLPGKIEKDNVLS
jgi:hypothetical protein